MNLHLHLIKLLTARMLGSFAFIMLALCSLQAQAEITADTYTTKPSPNFPCTTPIIGMFYFLNLDGEWMGMHVYRADSGKTSVVTRSKKEYPIRFDIQGVEKEPIPVTHLVEVDGRRGAGNIPGYTDDYGPEYWNYPHRIVFWVDFKETPGHPADDQRFEGYIMTQTEDAFAGITWKDGVPRGFHALKHGCFKS